MEARNVFYWGRQQFANLSASFLSTLDVTRLSITDYAMARMKHFNHQDQNVGDSVSMERDPSPDGIATGKMAWYSYPGKSAYNCWGTSPLPSLHIKVLPDGSLWYQLYQMNDWGHPTNVISTYSTGTSVLLRTNCYVYSPDGIDLLQAIGPDGVINAAYAYDAHHSVLFMTNALREVTSYTYNTDEQVTSITRPSGLITTNIYGADGWLATAYDYAVVGGSAVYYRTNTYTYSNGLVYTHTDERGLTVTNSCDALQRLTNVAYPDGKSLATIYDKLDVTRVVDRMGFTNAYAYNPIRQKIYETNALGRVTTFEYCECGALSYIIDALNNTTQMIHDNQGNLVNVIYPDGYSFTNRYNSIRQLAQRTDCAGNNLSYSYNNQGLITAITNNAGQVAAYAYDIRDRVINSVDINGVSTSTSYDSLDRPQTRSYPDSGVEKFGYTPNVPGMTSYTNQIGNVTFYGYDLLNRKTNEMVVGVTTNQFRYSGASDLLTLTDGKNQTTTWGYDAFGRVTNKLDAANTTIFSMATIPTTG